MTKTRPLVTPTVKEVGAKVIEKDDDYWKYSWRVVVEAPPHSECETNFVFVDEDDFQVASDWESSTVPSSGRLVVRGTIYIDKDLARTISNTLASIEVDPSDSG